MEVYRHHLGFSTRSSSQLGRTLLTLAPSDILIPNMYRYMFWNFVVTRFVQFKLEAAILDFPHSISLSLVVPHCYLSHWISRHKTYRCSFGILLQSCVRLEIRVFKVLGPPSYKIPFPVA